MVMVPLLTLSHNKPVLDFKRSRPHYLLLVGLASWIFTKSLKPVTKDTDTIKIGLSGDAKDAERELWAPGLNSIARQGAQAT